MLRFLPLLLLLACDDGGADSADAAVQEDTAQEDAAPVEDAAPEEDAAAPEDAGAADAAVDAGPDAGEFTVTVDDFECITDGTKVRSFYITNTLGHLEEALEVANNPEGGRYPPGTFLQLVPLEAMVKHPEGFSPETNDWEFFSLQVRPTGETTILDRGTTDVTNAFGLNCLDCHSLAAPQWDFVCEQDHGCDPLPIDAATIERFQQGDARCQ